MRLCINATQWIRVEVKGGDIYWPWLFATRHSPFFLDAGTLMRHAIDGQIYLRRCHKSFSLINLDLIINSIELKGQR